VGKLYLKTKRLLDKWVEQYGNIDFIPDDPISVPHRYSRREDIEISGLMTALISWGTRKAILKTARDWMKSMDDAPFDFVMNSSAQEQRMMKTQIYRTFQGEDMEDLLHALRQIYRTHRTLEDLFVEGFEKGEAMHGISEFRRAMLSHGHHPHFEKHLANPLSGSAAKRINMYLRWMVRKDRNGVDFGIWDNISMAQLSIPLDVHSGNVARSLGLLKRAQNDWKAVMELDTALRSMDPNDPVKYDFALFGAGVSSGHFLRGS
jgi:uncharacterized protein (TIGR02757 family)